MENTPAWLSSPLKNSRALHLSPIDCVHIVS